MAEEVLSVPPEGMFCLFSGRFPTHKLTQEMLDDIVIDPGIMSAIMDREFTLKVMEPIARPASAEFSE